MDLHPRIRLSLIVLVIWATSLFECSVEAGEPPTAQLKPFTKIPGLVVDFQNGCVDVEATICLTQGLLELVACTKGSKEHESIVSVSAKPMHIHTALLLLGATNGHPALLKQLEEEPPRWAQLSPKGDPIDVLLVVQENNRRVEYPIHHFMLHSDERVDEFDGSILTAPGSTTNPPAQEALKQQGHHFLFVGSHLKIDEQGRRHYLADSTGHVISIVTFGDEVLCLPGMQSHDNDRLSWRVHSGRIPKLGSRVTLRLRPRPKGQNRAPADPSSHKPKTSFSDLQKNR